MKIRYYREPEADLPHIYKHNVSENEVEDILLKPGEDRPGKEGSRIAMGQTRDGRYLRVVYVPDSDPERVFAITAFELIGKPLMAYKRRRRKKK
jgi:hypothetical protein